jgi:hypothetical protein
VRLALPRWAVHTLFLAGVYCLVLVAAALLLPHEWDWQAFKWMSSRVAPEFSQEVSIVDVAWDGSDVASLRRRIASFLSGMVKSGHHPNAVILDIEFVPCQTKPCGSPMSSARDALVASIRTATKSFPVYATEEPEVGRDDVLVGPVDAVDPRIYGALSGAAQTRFTGVPNTSGLFYRICYANVPYLDDAGVVAGTESVWAMVARVLMTPREFATAPVCDATHIPVRMGKPSSHDTETIYAFTDARSFSHYAAFDDKMFVIVGTIEHDRSPFADRSGPELLGWALSNALDQGSLVGRAPYYDVQPQNAMLLLLVPAFSLLAVMAYAVAFFLLKRTRLRGLRAGTPWLASAGAAGAGLGVFAIFEAWLLLSHHIQPQVSLITVGIVTAAGLSGIRGQRALIDATNAIDAPPAEVYDYDVFVSYAHEEGAWVAENVVARLRAATLPGGKKLSVFFDTSTIRAGTAWQTALSLAIDSSRFVIPVYSETYFKQPYCRFEIQRAHRKWILAGEDSRCILPVMRGHPIIMAAVDDIQALSIDDHPDLVAQHVAEIVTRLSRRDAAATEGSVTT